MGLLARSARAHGKDTQQYEDGVNHQSRTQEAVDPWSLPPEFTSELRGPQQQPQQRWIGVSF